MSRTHGIHSAMEISFYSLSDDLYTSGLHLSTFDEHLSSPFFPLSSRNLGKGVLAVCNRVRLDLQADSRVVVVWLVDRFWTEAEDGVFSDEDGDLGVGVAGLLDPSRAFEDFVSPETENTESQR